MGLHIQQNDRKSEFQNKLELDLKEKLKKRSIDADNSLDEIEDSNYLKNTKTTTSLAWAWLIVLALTIFVIFRLIIG